MKIRKMLFKIGGIMCSFAFMIALHSLDTMCISTWYQPKVPMSLEKYRKV